MVAPPQLLGLVLPLGNPGSAIVKYHQLAIVVQTSHIAESWKILCPFG